MFFKALHRNEPKGFSYDYWPLIEEQVLEFLEAWPEQFEEDSKEIEGWLRGPLLQAAVEPDQLFNSRKLKDQCAEIYARHPDFFLGAMVRLRQVDGMKFGIESQVRKWVMLNPTVNIMNQDFPLNRVDPASLSKMFKKDTGVDVRGDVIKGLVQEYQNKAA